MSEEQNIQIESRDAVLRPRQNLESAKNTHAVKETQLRRTRSQPVDKENLAPQRKQSASQPRLRKVKSQSSQENSGEQFSIHIDSPVHETEPARKRARPSSSSKALTERSAVAITGHGHAKKPQESLNDLENKTVGFPSRLQSYTSPKEHRGEYDRYLIYRGDIFEYLKKNDHVPKESRHFGKSRSRILFDWIYEVGHEVEFTFRTMCLAMDWVVRYFESGVAVPQSKLQLYGATALWMAAKLEEIYPPPVSDFEEACVWQYTAEEFIRAERDIVAVTEWRQNCGLVTDWIEFFLADVPRFFDLKTGDMYNKTEHGEVDLATELAQFFGLIAMIVEELRFHRPSLLALVCITMAVDHFHAYQMVEDQVVIDVRTMVESRARELGLATLEVGRLYYEMMWCIKHICLPSLAICELNPTLNRLKIAAKYDKDEPNHIMQSTTTNFWYFALKDSPPEMREAHKAELKANMIACPIE
eukprot:Clim_evm18s47 gene=Clim_evmTU18s47